tara:strand:+ start:3010 stop:4440 length:1431 start_codon:yes stop_codon:yes gene_type:complete
VNKLPIQPVILCGGTGSRLWPLSRESFPKQYLNLIGKSNNSLLQMTFLRLKPFNNIEDPILICNEKHRFIVAEQMREIGVKPKSIILEPIGRNTAPAVAIAALSSKLDLGDSILVILAADHSIKNELKFVESLKAGYKSASLGKLVTFGIPPNAPDTGFGYIESDKPLTGKFEPSSIIKFIEKPNYELAKKLILDKKFSWNSGIFMFKGSRIIDEFEKYEPHILNLCSNSLNNSEKDLDFLRLNTTDFCKCPDISIDNAIMEKTNLGVVLPLDVGWSDIGNWKSLWENEEKDSEGNFIKGNVIANKVKNSYLRSESKLIACLGVEDLVIVESSDAILITKKNSVQNVKSVVKYLYSKGFIEAKSHQKVYRPWGHYTSIAVDNRWQVKKIEVKAGASLSLQMHHHRSEHWIIVTGTALVQIDEKKEILSENQSVYIPLGTKHRLTNPGKVNLILIEVQSGSYLGEDDIYRFKDEYGR